MGSEFVDEALAAELRLLGRSVPDDGLPDRTAVAVLARLAGESAPAAPSRLRGQRRRLLIAAAAVLLSSLGVPAVRAAVLDWFSFAGVQVRISPVPEPPGRPVVPSARPATSLDQARALIGFPPVVPALLGPPQGVEVSTDHRVLSLSWTDTGRTVRLDQFDARLDYAFAKTATDLEWTTVGGNSALWFERPHEVALLDAAGNRRMETTRTAGHTLVWEQAGTTLRLEGDLSLARAVELAESARTVR